MSDADNQTRRGGCFRQTLRSGGPATVTLRPRDPHPGGLQHLLRGGRLPESEVERTTKDRRERQAATVGRPDPPMLTAVIGEFALRCGPPEVMKDQVDHLISATHQTRTQVLVIPNGTGLHAGLAGAFVLATLPGRLRVGYVDGPLRGDVTTDSDDIAKLELAWDIVSGLALPVDLSRKLIEKVADEYE